jgi:hypothetical protein
MKNYDYVHKDKPGTQEEANQQIIKAVKEMSPVDRKTFVYEGIKVLEKDGSENALLLASELRKNFVKH